MSLVTLNEMKSYLRVDSADENDLIQGMIQAAENLCMDVARLTQEQWDAYSTDEISDEDAAARELIRVAIFYTVGYLFEHREDADHHALTLMLRSLLFSIREGVI